MTDDLACRVAESRLAQICETLNLDAGHFSRIMAVQPVDRDAEAISDQVRLATACFLQISDPLLRTRLVELIVALAEYKLDVATYPLNVLSGVPDGDHASS